MAKGAMEKRARKSARRRKPAAQATEHRQRQATEVTEGTEAERHGKTRGPAESLPSVTSVSSVASRSHGVSSVTDGKRWYSISEAAAHLGVSEPTIYRWMKDGLLSFYKVGGSTRFEREGLDAVIEKTTGLKEAEAAAGRCASCGHAILVDGRLQGTGRLYFKPDKTRFWVFAESTVNVRARVCAACGFIQMHADTEKLRKLRPGEVK